MHAVEGDEPKGTGHHSSNTFDDWGADHSDEERAFAGWKDTSFDPISASAQTTSLDFHDEILSIVKETGLDSLAAETGLLQDGEIPSLRRYSSKTASDSAKLPEPETKNVVTVSSIDLANFANGLSRLPQAVKLESPRKSDFKDILESASAMARKRKRPGKNLPVPGDKASKGLRYSSLRVCQKVEEKKVTTYNEVADELVEEFTASSQPLPNAAEVQKNIRRRVYDALNVLMALGIIHKERKEIRWIGLPTVKNNKEEIENLEKQKQELEQAVQQKLLDERELATQFQNLQALIARNKQLPVPVSLPVHIPFLLIKSRHGTVINCEVADDRMQYGFTFSHPFELFDDATLMVQMGLQAAADGAAGHAVEEVQAQVSPARPARKKRG